jgi:SSS family solute:Na+ symporter
MKVGIIGAGTMGQGICKALFGRDVLIEAYPFPMIDPILFALPLSVMAIVVVSWVTGRK